MRIITIEKEQNNFRKCSTFSSASFTLIFHFKLSNLCWRGRKNISCPRPRAQDTFSGEPLKQTIRNDIE